MSDIQQWRGFLQQKIAEVTKFRNSGEYNSKFKAWRQQLVDAIATLWPGDDAKTGRFRRIPFLPASAKAERPEMRRAFEKGAGEALAMLKAYMAEFEKEVASGKRGPDSGGGADSNGPGGDEVMPNLSWMTEGEPAAAARDEVAGAGEDDVRQSANDFLSSSPIFAGITGAEVKRPPKNDDASDEPIASTPPPATPPSRPAQAAPRKSGSISPAGQSLMALAVELEDLGVTEAHRARIRDVLLELARNLDTDRLTWDQLRHATDTAMSFPVLAKRLLPILMPYMDRAA